VSPSSRLKDKPGGKQKPAWLPLLPGFLLNFPFDLDDGGMTSLRNVSDVVYYMAYKRDVLKY
jgi:hypothetical protein